MPYSAYSENAIPVTPVPEPSPRPWWKEGYVWMVIAGPGLAILACAITAVYIFRGPDAVLAEDHYPEGVEIKRQLTTAEPPMQPALTGRNYSATGGSIDGRR